MKVVPPSLLNVYVPVPPETEVTIEPSFPPQLGSVVVEVNVNVPIPGLMVAVNVPWQPAASSAITLYVPTVNPVNRSPVWNVVPSSIL